MAEQATAPCATCPGRRRAGALGWQDTICEGCWAIVGDTRVKSVEDVRAIVAMGPELPLVRERLNAGKCVHCTDGIVEKPHEFKVGDWVAFPGQVEEVIVGKITGRFRPAEGAYKVEALGEHLVAHESEMRPITIPNLHDAGTVKALCPHCHGYDREAQVG